MRKPTSYLHQLVVERRARPGADVISALASGGENGDRLSGDELVAACALPPPVGQESATNLIGNGMLALLQHPDQRRLLIEDDSLAANAIEELLRFDSPVQFAGRRAARDVDLAGHRIPAGDHVMLMIGAADRDPAVFDAPDSLDIRRREIRHLSFGAGAHFCLGYARAPRRAGGDHHAAAALPQPALEQRTTRVARHPFIARPADLRLTSTWS